MRKLLTVLAFLLLPTALAAEALPKVDLVRVVKSERRMELRRGDVVVRTYSIALGGNPVGHKLQEGDGRTPEGRYVLDWRNRNSVAYRSMHISYPNYFDSTAAMAFRRPAGGNIMIHGQMNGFGWLYWLTQRFDWTDGCIAVKNADMEEIWRLVRDGTAIEILP